MLHDLQRAFAHALFAPAGTEALAQIAPDGLDPARRLFVHFNTIATSLSAALAASFPALQALLGADAFRRAALAHIRRQPPRQAALLHYGEDFPDSAAAVTSLDPDLIRSVGAIEWAQKCAFHAADAAVMDEAAFGAIPADRLPNLRLAPHPALRLLAFATPALAVMQAALHDPVAALALAREPGGPSFAAVTRPDVTPQVHPLTAGVHALLESAAAGDTLHAAMEAALAREPSLDPGLALATMAGIAAFSEIRDQNHDQTGT